VKRDVMVGSFFSLTFHFGNRNLGTGLTQTRKRFFTIHCFGTTASQRVTLSLKITYIASHNADNPSSRTHEKARVRSQSTFARLLSSTASASPDTPSNPQCPRKRRDTVPNSSTSTTLEVFRSQFSASASATANEIFNMKQRNSALPILQHTPYPGAEPVPDCVWVCCGCRRRWETKELGNICVGCSHRYSVDCCQLAG